MGDRGTAVDGTDAVFMSSHEVAGSWLRGASVAPRLFCNRLNR